jgi:D-methionine transport system substrate-binding protein
MNTILRKATGAVTIVLSIALVASCGSASSTASSDTKSISVGTSPGPYSELFKKGVAPVLQKEGYTIKYTSFSDLQTADVALNEGSVDLNVDQHTAYIEAFNKNKGGDLVPLQAIPTVPAGLYSQRHTSLKDVSDANLIAISQDPSNESRGLRLLERIGWITLKPDADPVTVTPNDIEKNPKNLQIKPMDSATIPRSLEDLDYAVIPGSISYSSKVDPNLQLAQEKLQDEYLLQVTVKEANKKASWAKDVVKAYKSSSFLNYLDKNNTNNYWFVPESLKQ